MPIYSDILENAFKVLSRKSEEAGKLLLPETRARIAEVASPLLERASSPTKDINRGRLFNSLMSSEAPETANKEIVRASRRGMETVPDWYYQDLNPQVNFSKNQAELATGLPNRYRFGQYDHSTKGITLNQYVDPSVNPTQIISHAYDTPPHELLHFGTYAGKDALRSSRLASAVDDVANVRGTSSMLRSAQKEIPRFNDWLKQKTGKTLYEIDPVEGSANAFTDFLNAGHYDIADAFKKSHSKAMDDFARLLPDFAKKGMEWGDKYRGVVPPVVATGTALAAGASTEAKAQEPVVQTESPEAIASRFFQPATSNIDTAASQEPSVPRANIPLGEGPVISPFLQKVGKLIGTEAGHVWDLGKAAVNAFTDLASAFDPSGEGAKKYMETHSPTDLIGDLLTVGGGSAAADAALLGGSVKGGLGAIGLPGFFSPLTKALEEKQVGKSLLSPKMSGEQVLSLLRKGGIKDDELLFSGVHDALMSIGKDRIGETKLNELAGIAREGALGFTKEVSPGIYSSYSLFKGGDPSFKNAVYKLPGIEFEEGHFGKGVVAHRRYGDKVIGKEPFKIAEEDWPGHMERTPDDTGWVFVKNPGYPMTYENGIDSLHLGEVQSQFYEKGSRFGHGTPKVPSKTTVESKAFGEALDHVEDGSDWSLEELKKLEEKHPGISKDAQDYADSRYLSASTDRSTPQGFANGLKADADQDAMYSKWYGSGNAPVEDAPLRGDKWVELVAKDHLLDALREGKGAVSWETSAIQHERYYGKEGLGGIEWDFHKEDAIGKAPASTSIMLTFRNGHEMELSSVAEMNKNIGTAATKKLLQDLESGKTSGMLEGNAKEVYQKLYDRLLPKYFEKLTGEKPRSGWVKDANGKDVEIQWVPLDKVKERMVKAPTRSEEYPGERKAIENLMQEQNTGIKSYSKMIEESAELYDRSLEYLSNKSKKVVDDAIKRFTNSETGEINWRGIREFTNNDPEITINEANSLRQFTEGEKYKERLINERNDLKFNTDIIKELEPEVKELPIASADQIAREFFNV